MELGHAAGQSLQDAGQATGRFAGGDEGSVEVIEAGGGLTEGGGEGRSVLKVEPGAGADLADTWVLLFFRHDGEGLLDGQAGFQ